MPNASETIIVVADDYNTERRGNWYRAFWTSPTSNSMVPVRGYCEARGSFRTIRACASDAARLHPNQPIHRLFRGTNSIRAIKP